MFDGHVFVGAPVITERIPDLSFLPTALDVALQSTRNVFYDRLTEATYGVDALSSACGLDKESSKAEGTYDSLYNHFVDFSLRV